MLGKMFSLGFNLATLPARMTYRGARAMLAMPGDYEQVMAELRQASDEVAREVQTILSSVDTEMSGRTAHLSQQQKQQAAQLALEAAEKHLSMAAMNMLRAIWLAANSSRKLQVDKGGAIIEDKHGIIIDNNYSPR